MSEKRTEQEGVRNKQTFISVLVCACVLFVRVFRLFVCVADHFPPSKEKSLVQLVCDEPKRKKSIPIAY